MKRLLIVVALLATVAGCTSTTMVEVEGGHCELVTSVDSAGNVITTCQWASSGTMMKIPSTELPGYWELRKCEKARCS